MVQKIEVKNVSTLLTNAQLDRILTAVTAQVNEDVRREWQTPEIALVQIGKDAGWSPDAWQFTVADTTAQAFPGQWGYHNAAGGIPVGFALINPTLDHHCQPSVTISHEIIEMVADPILDQYRSWGDDPDASRLSLELCDPVQADSYGYDKNGVLVCDFVTQAYFVPDSSRPWDHTDLLLGPNTVGEQGVQTVVGASSRLMQAAALDTGGRTSPEFTTPLSRRMRRNAKLAVLGAAATRPAAPQGAAAAGGQSASASPWGRWFGQTLLFIGLMVACGAWIAVSAWHRSAGDIRTQWLAAESTLILLCIVAGLATNGRADGIFIDEENRISLGRLQWAAWFVVLFGGFFTESIWNIAAGWSDPVKGSFPNMQNDLYILLGIVSGSAVAGSVIIDSKKNAPSPQPAPAPQAGAPAQQGVVDCNVSSAEASWQDLYFGEEVANRNVVDISRLQKLVITILLVMTYVQMLWTALGDDLKHDPKGHLVVGAHFAQMPQVGESFLWLLGISHAAYLAYKAVPKTPVSASK